MERICQQCHQAFTPSVRGRPPTFCSTECRCRFWVQQNPDRVAYHRKARKEAKGKPS